MQPTTTHESAIRDRLTMTYPCCDGRAFFRVNRLIDIMHGKQRFERRCSSCGQKWVVDIARIGKPAAGGRLTMHKVEWIPAEQFEREMLAQYAQEGGK